MLTASWKWANGQTPVLDYACDEYKRELQLWLDNEWPLPYPEDKLGPSQCLIPSMAVIQNKQKDHPVLDYRELNGFMDAYTTKSEQCAQKLQGWWQGTNVCLVDLRKAYLQIHDDKVLLLYQTVTLEGRRYCLTWLGFGLNVAPLIMQSIIDSMMSQDRAIKNATSTYTYINEVLVPAACERAPIRLWTDL